jgi:hypothetical protein
MLLSVTFIACSKPVKRNNHVTLPDSTDVFGEVSYTDRELENFLDSVSRLSPDSLAERVSSFSDSLFNSQEKLNISLTERDFSLLKEGCKASSLDVNTANRIFGGFRMDSSLYIDGRLPITFFSFEDQKDNFNEFAVSMGYPDAGWDCDLFFFKQNKIISRHRVHHRYGLDLHHYKDRDGRTVVYYKENFQSGSGIWWFNFFFYKYDNGSLLPVLNEIENANLQAPWGVRVLWLETSVVSTNPLKLKMVYNQALFDSLMSPPLVDDSTFVEYTWNEKMKRLEGNYNNSRITKAQILSYYLQDNEVLFMNAYHDVLKSNLKDRTMRPYILSYLNKVKHHQKK